MTSGVEREYRRLLRLLPVGYRDRWADEMVGAYLDRVEGAAPTSARLPMSERLSVIALALRLRLAGSHATPRGRVWYEAVRALALLMLLYQALAATLSVANMIRNVVVYAPSSAELPYFGLFVFHPVVGLLWVCAFICLVLDRVAAARNFAVAGATATMLVTVAMQVINGPAYNAFSSLSGSDISRWGWLAGSVVVILLCPDGAAPRRLLWFGAYGVAAGALVPIALNAFRSVGVGYQYSDLSDYVSTLGTVTMIAALLYWVLARRAPLPWLLAVATFAGGITLVHRLTRGVTIAGRPTAQEIARSLGVGPVPRPSLDLIGFVSSTDGFVVILALGCIGAVLVTLRRTP